MALAAGARHSLGLKADGSIVAWGSNSFGQCSVPAPNRGFVGLAAGGEHSLGLKADTGDVNCDGLVNNGDIDVFILALTDSAGYAAAHPRCHLLNADINGDGLVNNGDIDPFIALLTGG